MRNTYIPGEYNVVCDRCGFKLKASGLQEEWTGLRVCGGCFETRHPQTLIHVPPEQVAPDWTRPEHDDVFITVPYISPTVGTQK